MLQVWGGGQENVMVVYMVDIQAVTFESLADDLWRMGKQLTPGFVCAPTWVKLRCRDGEEQLHWGFDTGSASGPIDLDRQQWRRVRATRNFLQRFLKLADARAEDIETFAKRFGVLAICQQHGLPVSHQEGCPPLGFADDCHEPLRHWRQYAARMRAVHDIARELRAGRLGQDSDWRVLDPHFEKNQPFSNIWVDETARNWRARKHQQALLHARSYLSSEMDSLLELADVRLQLEWQRAARSRGLEQPAQWVVRVRYGPWLNLFGALVVQLLLEVCESGEDVYVCSGCEKSYTREGIRHPNASQNNYCPSCRNAKEPQREADKRRRRRMREARVLHDQGVSLQQIAQRLNAKSDSVARWLKTRVRRSRR